MAKHSYSAPSIETQNEAMAIANKIKKAGQSKDQTKLIAAGIQKGIAEYKKSVKEKQRQADKEKKKQKRMQATKGEENSSIPENKSPVNYLFITLILSWCGFAAYYLTSH